MASSEKPSEPKTRKEGQSTEPERHETNRETEEVDEGKPVNEEREAQEANGKDTNEAQKEKHEDTSDKPTKRKRKRKRKSKSASTETGDEKGSEESAIKLASLDHTVYVEGIPFECTEDEVKEFFVSHGIDDVLQLRLPR